MLVANQVRPSIAGEAGHARDRQQPSFTDDIRLGVFVGLFLLVLKAPLILLPSQDDITPLHDFFVEGSLGSLLVQNLRLVRLLVLPVYALSDALGIPNFSVALVASLFVDASWATLAIALFRRIGPEMPRGLLLPLTVTACLSPGMLGLSAFWNVRLNLLLANAALIAFILAWFGRPQLRAAAIFLTTLTMMLLYPGSVNMALAVVVLLFARFVGEERLTIGEFVRSAGMACAAVILAAVTFVLITRAVDLIWGVYPGKFSFISPPEIAAKLGHIARTFRNQIVMTNATLVTIGFLLLSAVILAASRFGRANARYFLSLGLALLGFALLGLQLPSLPVAQGWYPGRTFLFLFFSVAGIVALAGANVRLVGTAAVAAMIFAWGAALTATVATATWSASYAQMRARDFATARDFINELQRRNFDWMEPIVVDFGEWPHYTRWGPGISMTGDVAPLLAVGWSSGNLIALMAGRQLVKPTDEMRAEAREICAENRSEPIEPRVIERETFWALCL